MQKRGNNHAKLYKEVTCSYYSTEIHFLTCRISYHIREFTSKQEMLFSCFIWGNYIKEMHLFMCVFLVFITLTPTVLQCSLESKLFKSF